MESDEYFAEFEVCPIKSEMNRQRIRQNRVCATRMSRFYDGESADESQKGVIWGQTQADSVNNSSKQQIKF